MILWLTEYNAALSFVLKPYSIKTSMFPLPPGAVDDQAPHRELGLVVKRLLQHFPCATTLELTRVHREEYLQ